MALLPGTRLGTYEITELIGAGGMGEVYRARDTRLQRDVAIKTLPPDLLPSAEQLARLEREACSLAALNHSNIAHLYGIEESTSAAGAVTRALVMEFVDGEDLAQRLRRGSIEVNEALRIAVQIAQALEAAHDQGIIHRDLKPANIKLTSDGTVKLLDFGLAKVLDPAAPGASDAITSPTITRPAYVTRHGVVLGTAAYMSPEQARGFTVDSRADVWAFGAVLYEMLTGARVFPGDTVSDTIAGVLKAEPDWTLLPSSTPYLARRVMINCLRKNARERLAHIHDANIDLTDALSGGDALAQPSAVSAWRLPWLAVLATIVSAVAIGVTSTRALSGTPPAAGIIRSSLILADHPVVNGKPAVSPDGRSIVYNAPGPRSGLWLRRLDEATSRFLVGTEGGIRPFWSPDSSQVGYSAGGKLRSIQIASGVVTEIVAVRDFFGGSWSADDVIIFGVQGSAGLQRVAARGGAATVLTEINASEIAHRWPFFFADGQHFGYVSQRDDGADLMVASLNGGAAASVTAVQSSVTFAPPDILLIVRNGQLFAHRFNVRDRTLSAEGVKVAEGVGVPPSRETSVSVSSGGGLVYLPPRTLPTARLAWVDRAGHASYLDLPEGPYGEPALSPDGSKVAMSVREPSGADLWMYEIDRGAFGRRTFTGANTFALWSPDGRNLTFTRAVAQSGPLMQMSADGSGTTTLLVSSSAHPGVKTATSWSPDGTVLLFQLGGDLMIRHADGSVQPLLATAAVESEGRFSPDGRWFAYKSNETGVDQVFVQSYPVGRGKWQLSASGGAQPMWAPNGSELFFVNGNRMMVATTAFEPTFKPGMPRVLYEVPLTEREVGDPSRYAVSADGKRFLVLTGERAFTPPAQAIHMIANWRALLPP